MPLTDDLRRILTDFLHLPEESARAVIHLSAEDCWRLEIRGRSAAWPDLTIRSAAAGDAATLARFGAGLGAASRALFYPYPWNEPAALPGAYQTAIDRAVNRINPTYFIECGSSVAGHFFLFGPVEGPAARPDGVCLPVLGVAIADAWQGRGLGTLSVRILQAIARQLGADGIELTTLSTNLAGQYTYRRCGFEATGTLPLPNAARGTVPAAFELQMLHVIRPEKRVALEARLRAKRPR